MKKQFFFFAMLASVAASAQTGITIAPISADYASQTVRFSVSWANGSRNATHNSKVWVFIDYRTVTNNVPSGSWARALISGTPTATTGTPSRETGNDKGFWLQGNSGAYSATVTVKLSNVPTKFNWCAYVSDYPPNATINNGTYTLKGTPPFTLIAANGTTTQTVSGKTLTTSALTITPTTIKDKTECPGVFCPYTGSDLYMDATHLCRQRPSGEENWEAWIRDSRDSKFYRIVLMPDNKWWLAQNVKLATYNSTTVGAAISGCTEDECGRSYSWAQAYGSYGGTSGSSGNVQGICPNGWLLPITADLDNLVVSMGSMATACHHLRGLTASCSPKTNGYGWANLVTVAMGKTNRSDEWFANDENREDGLKIDVNWNASGYECCATYTHTATPAQVAHVRCFRQL